MASPARKLAYLPAQARAWVNRPQGPPVRDFPLIACGWHYAASGLCRCAQDSVGIMLMETTQGCTRDVRGASCRCYV